MLTRQDREEIKAIVMSFATRISELPEIETLHDGDIITVVQREYDRTYSKRASINDLLDLIKLTYPDQNGAKYQGIAHPDDTVSPPVGTDGFWLAIEPGVYTNFNNITVTDVPKVIYYNVSTGEWSDEALWGDVNGTARMQVYTESESIVTDKFSIVGGRPYYIEGACLPVNSLGTIILNEYDHNGTLIASTRGVDRVTVIASVNAYYGKFVLESNPLNPIDVSNSAVLVTASLRSLVEGLYRYSTGYDKLNNRIAAIEQEFAVGGKIPTMETAISNLANAIDNKVSVSTYEHDTQVLSQQLSSINGSIEGLGTSIGNLSTAFDNYTRTAPSNIATAIWTSLTGNTGDYASSIINPVHIPVATSAAIGGIKVGSRLNITDGVLNVPIASANELGLIKVGSGLNIDANGVLSASGGGGGGNYLPLSAGSSNPLTGELFANAGITIENTTSSPILNIKGDSAKIRILVDQSKTWIQSGNAAFNNNVEMRLTGYNGNAGSSLVLHFSNVSTYNDLSVGRHIEAGGNVKVTDYLGVGADPTSLWRAYINGNMNVAGSDLHLTGSANSDTFFTAQGSTRSISFGVGSGNTNRGIWDAYHNEWMIYNDDSYTRVSRNFVGTGAVTAGSASDVRLKDNIVTMSVAIARNIIMTTRPVTFTWNDKATKLLDTLKGNDFGFVAQEVEAIVPQAISPIWNIYKRVDYTKYVSPMLAMLQDHESRIDKLEKIVKERYGLEQ